MGIRKELMDKGKKIESEGKGLLIGTVRERKRRWRIDRSVREWEYGKDDEEFRDMDGGERRGGLYINRE